LGAGSLKLYRFIKLQDFSDLKVRQKEVHFDQTLLSPDNGLVHLPSRRS